MTLPPMARREPTRRVVRNGALLRDVGADSAAAGEPRGLQRRHTVWHRDLPAPCDSWPRPFQRYIKSCTYIWGNKLVGGEGGEGALV